MSSQTKPWRERLHAGLAYFGLDPIDEEERSEPAEPGWLMPVRLAPPIVGAFVLHEALGYSSGFLTLLGIALACVVLWSLVVDLGLRVAGSVHACPDSLASRLPLIVYVVGWSVLLIWALGDFEGRIGLFMLWASGGPLLTLAARKARGQQAQVRSN